MRIRTKQVNFAIYALFIAIFKVYIIPQTVQQALKILLLIYVLLFLFSNVKIKDTLNITVPFGGVIILTSFLSYLAGHVGIESIFNGLLHAICLYSIYMLMKYCNNHNYFERMINCLFQMTSIYCLLSLSSMIILGHSREGTEITYFFGYKFMTSYYFILWVSLFRIKYQYKIIAHKRYKVAYLAFSISTIFVCLWLYCSTAMIASILLLLEPFLSKKVKKIAMNHKIIITVIIAAGILPFFINVIINLSFVQHLITDFLHKSLNLTGRIKIYAYLHQIISKRSLVGYGYGNVAVGQVVGYGNAQNGLMQLIVDYGFIGTFLFFVLTFNCLKNQKSLDKMEGFYILIYIMIICSTVEISYNYIFYTALFIIGCFNTKQSLVNNITT